jgi:hypothetical protein
VASVGAIENPWEIFRGGEGVEYNRLELGYWTKLVKLLVHYSNPSRSSASEF